MPHNARPIIGVDIDGVLADQVTGVLERAAAKFGVSLRYEEVVHWDVELGDSSFVPEIGKAMRDAKYVREMRLHPGASTMLETLAREHEIHLLTVRPPEAHAPTLEWLSEHQLPYDELVLAKEGLKSAHGAVLLVDDYGKNLREFVQEDGRRGILVDQPWNQAEDGLESALADGRLLRVEALADVPDAVNQLLNVPRR